MKVLIIEDESLAAEKLERSLGKMKQPIQVLAKLESVEESVKWLNTQTADLIFCDIHLGDGLSFAIFEKVNVKTPVIFTTAYDQYALQAFKLNSIDYLLKPINSNDLQQALDKFTEWHEPINEQLDIAALIDAVSGKQQEHQKRFMIYVGERIITVPTEDINYFYAEGKYVFLVTSDGKEHIVDYTLDRLMQLLSPEQFFRVNRQFIVALQGIAEMVAYSKSRVKLELNPKASKPVVVSTERAANFKRWLNK